MNNITPIGIHPYYTSHKDKNEKLGDLATAVESLLSSPTEEQLLGRRLEKRERQKNVMHIQQYLAQTKISVDLLSGDYQAGLRAVAPLFFLSDGTLGQKPYLNILIALLARLKRKSPLKKSIPFSSPESEQLDAIVNLFIQKDGVSPNDAISINYTKLHQETNSADIKKIA